MSDNMYIVSLKWTHPDDGFITLWRSTSSYAFYKEWITPISRTLVETNPKHYNDGVGTKAYTEAELKDLWLPVVYEELGRTILPNTEKVRKSLGITLNMFKKAQPSSCPSRRIQVERFSNKVPFCKRVQVVK